MSRADEVANLAREGLRNKEIAERLGISRQRVCQLRQRVAENVEPDDAIGIAEVQRLCKQHKVSYDRVVGGAWYTYSGRYKLLRRGEIKERIAAEQERLAKRRCLMCGKTVSIGRRKYCSERCHRAWAYRQRKRGVKKYHRVAYRLFAERKHELSGRWTDVMGEEFCRLSGLGKPVLYYCVCIGLVDAKVIPGRWSRSQPKYVLSREQALLMKECLQAEKELVENGH